MSDEVWKEIDELKKNGDEEAAEDLLNEWRTVKEEVSKDLSKNNAKNKGQEVSQNIKEKISKFKKEKDKGEVNEE